MVTYDIAGRKIAYRVLSSKRDGAEHDEDQDEVGKDLMVDQLVAEYTKPTEQRQRRYSECNRKPGFVTQF